MGILTKKNFTANNLRLGFAVTVFVCSGLFGVTYVRCSTKK